MQGQDFLFRRLLRDEGAGLRAFADRMRGELGESGPSIALLERFESLSGKLAKAEPPVQLAAADGYLRCGWAVVSACLAQRLLALGGEAANAAGYWMMLSAGRLALAEAQVTYAMTRP